MSSWWRVLWRRYWSFSTGYPSAISSKLNLSAHSFARCALTSLFSSGFVRVQCLDCTVGVYCVHFILSLFSQFLNVPAFRNVTLQCLTEICELGNSGIFTLGNFDSKFSLDCLRLIVLFVPIIRIIVGNEVICVIKLLVYGNHNSSLFPSLSLQLVWKPMNNMESSLWLCSIS